MEPTKYTKYLVLLTTTIVVHLSEVRIVHLPIVQQVSLLYLIGPLLLLLFPFVVEKVEISRVGVAWSYIYILMILVLILGHPVANIITTFDHILVLFLGILVVSILNTDAGARHYVVKGLIIGTIPLLVLDVFAAAGLIPFIRASGFLNNFGIYSGGMGVPNTAFGAHGVMLISGFWGTWYAGSKRRGVEHEKRRYLYTLSYFLMIGAILFFILLSNSRSSYMALLLGIVSAIALFFISSKRYKIPVFLFIVVSLVGFALVILNPDSLIERVSQLIVGFDVVMQSPLRGIGWNNFYLTHYARAGLHNSLVYYFVAGGIIAGILITIFILYPIIVSVTYAKQNDIGRWHIALFGIYIAVVVESLLWRSTPNAHQVVFGLVLLESMYGNVTA